MHDYFDKIVIEFIIIVLLTFSISLLAKKYSNNYEKKQTRAILLSFLKIKKNITIKYKLNLIWKSFGLCFKMHSSNFGY